MRAILGVVLFGLVGCDCPAVMEDRLHVDAYGYTSLLLVTVQEQAKQIAALQKRLEAVEQRCR